MPAATTDYDNAVAGLFRMVLEPEAVVGFVSALDAMAESDSLDETLAALQSQLAVAESLSARLQTKPSSAAVEYLLLTHEHRILTASDVSRLFQQIADKTAPGEVFSLRDQDSQFEFQQILRAIPEGAQRFLSVKTSASDPPVTLAIARAAATEDASGTAYMVAAPRASEWSEELARAFDEFKLTGAEMRVLRAMRTDQTAADLARGLGVGEATVRSQIKSLLGKLGVARQAELIRFREEAMRLSHVIADQLRVALADAAGSNPPFFVSGRIRPPRRLVSLNNLRRVSYREFGLANGPVLVVMHGAHSGSMIPDGYKPAALQLGLRLIAPDRPGFGQSSPSTLDTSIEDAAAETVELIDRLGVETYGVIGLASASACALEVARIDPRATHLVLCSPHFGAAALPGARPGFGLVLRQQLVQRAPWLMERGSRVFWSSMSWEAVRSVARGLLRRSPSDLHALQRDGLDTYFADIVIDARQSPPDGQIWEARALSAYEFSGDIAKPVAIICGDQDPATDSAGVSKLFKPENVSLHSLKGGQLFYYNCWPEVLQLALTAPPTYKL